MAKKMLIDATHAEETRVVVVDGNKVEEFDFESQQKRQLAGNIYLAKVTRVEPSLQAAFVDYGGNRHGFLAFSEIHPDYYQIPVADRQALLEEERAYAESLAAEAAQAEEEAEKPKRSRRRRGGKSAAAKAQTEDAVETRDVSEITGMETIDLVAEEPAEDGAEGEAPAQDAASSDDQPPHAKIVQTSDAKPLTTEEVAAESASEIDDAADQTDAAGPEDQPEQTDGSDEDTQIESVAQEEDDAEDVRPVRKPRPRRYKIQEVINVRQVLLVQVVKEERGNKGAALTTYLSLAGRYCVLMPNTARGGGISRKITNVADRKKLKEIAGSMAIPDGAGLIVRTAGAKRTGPEIKRDYEYLQRLWEQIRSQTLQSTAPAKIYEEGDLIKRTIRDLYNRDIDEVLVEGDTGFETAKNTMQMIMPTHAKNVKHYKDSMPLFARYQVESFLDGMFNPVVQLKSGGYLVIAVTEALVAVDVNSGRATKEGSIEQTALNTNLEAAEEMARQVRLRDLAGLIVIDFIDMEERRNNNAVEKRLKDKLKTDRARIQVGRISGFGLLEMSRQRLRPGMLEATTQPCPSCHGTGLIRSNDSMGLTILREVEEEGVRRRTKEVLVKAPVDVANFLINEKRERIIQIEQRHGMSVRIEGDVSLVSPNYTLEKFKTSTRFVPEPAALVTSVDLSLMEEIDETVEAEAQPIPEGEEAPKKKRRRRRRRKGDDADAVEQTDASDAKTDEGDDVQDAKPAEDEDAKPKRRRRTRGRGKGRGDDASVDTAAAEAQDADTSKAEEQPAVDDAAESSEDKPKKRTRRPRKPKADKVEETAKTEDAPEAVDTPAQVVEEAAAQPAATPEPAAVAEPAAPAPMPEIAVADAAPAVVAAAPEPEAKPAPKRRGWWSMGRG
ncbi:MAG: ribonuclease E/G [Planktomarina sp.]